MGDVLEFPEGRLGLTWSSEAFYNGETGIVIHLNNARCYLVEHHMDHKQAGHNSAHLLSAEFANTTARKGQKIDMHPRFMRPNGYTKKELQNYRRRRTKLPPGTLKGSQEKTQTPN